MDCRGAFGVLAALSAGAWAERRPGPPAGGAGRAGAGLPAADCGGGAASLLLAVTTAPAVSALGIPRWLPCTLLCSAPGSAVQNEQVSPGGRAARLSRNAMVEMYRGFTGPGPGLDSRTVAARRFSAGGGLLLGGKPSALAG